MSGVEGTTLPVAEAQLLRWMNDEEALECVLCKSEFTIFNRRHHCRKCGSLFCQDCCSYFIELNTEQILYPPNSLTYTLDLVFGNTVRCCKTCADMVLGGNSHTRTTYSVDDSTPSQPTILSGETNNNSTVLNNNKAPTTDNNSTNTNNDTTQNLNLGNNSNNADIPRDVVAPAVMKEVLAMEYVPGEPSKRYIVNVPSDIRRGGAFSVYLDSRIMTVRLTTDINPGERIYVRAPTANVVPVPAVARPVTRDASNGSSSITVLVTITCTACTFENTVPHHSVHTSLRCHFCNTLIPLDSQDDVGSQSVPSRRRVSVLEMPLELLQNEEDPQANSFIKQFAVVVPIGTKRNEIFKVVLSSRLFHVLCPADASVGDKLIVSAPDKSCPFPLNYRFKNDYDMGNASADPANVAPNTAPPAEQDDAIDPDVLFARANQRRLRQLIGDETNDVSEEDKIAMLIAAGMATSADDARSIIQSCVAKNAEKPIAEIPPADNTTDAVVVASTVAPPTDYDDMLGESKESSVAVSESVAIALPQATIVEAREVCTYVMNSRAVENELIAIAEETILCRYCTSVNHPDARVCLVCRRRFQ